MASSKKKNKLYMSSHQRSWVWGRHAVRELLRSGSWQMKELYVSDDVPDDLNDEVLGLADQLGVVPEIVSNVRIFELCHQSDHQGLLARMTPFPYVDEDDFMAKVPATALVLVLDRIQDSHNFGALIRSAEVFGVDAVIVGDKGQAGVNGQVVRSSAGAVSRVPLIQSLSLPASLVTLSGAGCSVMATVPEDSNTLGTVDLKNAVALVIGNEGDGISPEVLGACTGRCRIPQVGEIASLNAAAAGAIVLYEASRQRQAR